MSDWVMMTGMADPAMRPIGMRRQGELSRVGKLGLLALTVALHLLLLLGWPMHRPMALSQALAPLSISMVTSSSPLRGSHPHSTHPHSAQPDEPSAKAQAVAKPPQTRRTQPVHREEPRLTRKLGPRPAASTPRAVVQAQAAPAAVTAALASRANAKQSATAEAQPSKESRAATVASPSSRPASNPAILRREARFDAAYLHNPRPAYPPFSLRLHEEGRVVLRVLVSRVGSAQRVLIAQSSGHQRLDRSAQETVKRWRFVPAQMGHETTDAWVLVPINFSLRGEA
jgi:protein TonB